MYYFFGVNVLQRKQHTSCYKSYLNFSLRICYSLKYYL